jgi:hypothetical protein
MKSIFSFIVIVIFIGCVGSKNLSIENEHQVNIQIISAEYSDWVGGVQNVAGISVKIIVNKQNLKVDSLYFRNQSLLPEFRKLEDGNLLITANLNKRVKPDYTLHKEASKEYGNDVPKRNVSFPFELNSDECILRYTHKKKTHLLKVKLEKGKTNFYQ